MDIERFTMEVKDFEKEHPIPQDISAYQFRLVGDMTIKQFMQVAAGALFSLLIYSSGIPPYVKWPLIIISFLSGIALAFFPIEDRPLAKWISLFLKAIYSPTIYRWQAGVQRVNLFQPEPAPGSEKAKALKSQFAKTDVSKQVPPSDQKTPQDQTAPGVTPSQKLKKEETDVLNESEAQFLQKVNQAFTEKPADVDIDKLIKEKAEAERKVVVPQKGEVKVEIGDKQVSPNQIPDSQTTSQVGGEVKPLTGQDIKAAKAATFSAQAAPPAPPTKANVIVGQVIDEEGNIVDNVILEIKDNQGRPVRALKSNRLGHFMIVTPLVNGNYQIISEKEGYKFDTVNIEAKDTIIPPIAIKGQKLN